MTLAAPGRALLAGATGALAALGLAACGIPTDDGPRAISRENVPDVDTTTEATAPTQSVPGEIFLVQSPDQDPQLVAVERDIPVENPSSSPPPDAVLETLLTATADDQEREAGISNLIPHDTRLASQPEAQGRTLMVDLTRAIFDVVGENQRAAFGQIVCTVDKLGRVDAVRFEVDGEPVEVPTSSGTTDEPVTCARDYGSLLPDNESQ
jgi:spore germination protein GerM